MTQPDSSYDIDLEIDEPFAGTVDLDALRALLEAALKAEGVEAGAGVAVRIAGDTLLHELNRAHRGTDEPTDVLSFGADEGEPFPGAPDEPRYLGDIAVSIEAIERQAATARLAVSDELAHVVLHGILHLLGYDHESDEDDATMRAREERVLGPAIHAGRERHSDD